MTQQCETDRQSRENTTLQERRLEIRPTHTEERKIGEIHSQPCSGGKEGRETTWYKDACVVESIMHVNLGGRLIHYLSYGHSTSLATLYVD